MVSQQNNTNRLTPMHHDRSMPSSGLEKTGTLDTFAHDTRNDILILAMFELRPWDKGEVQLFQLQEKLNAYVSFVLDGEMAEMFPHLKEKPVRIELRTLHEPSEQALGFIARAQEQLSHQQISLEVVLIKEQLDGCRCDHLGAECCGGPSMIALNQSDCCKEDQAMECCGGGCDTTVAEKVSADHECCGSHH